ncbi:MAG: NAD(P)/FAD-dependent oxidoreductase [Anaerolineales bacterium]
MKRVAIIGAGAGGLAAAYDLARAGNSVTIYEADDHVGGLASGFKQSNWTWSVERYYHHWFASDNHILGLIDELGLSERVIFPRPVTVVYHDQQFYALDSPIAVMRFPGIPFIDRLRFGAVVAYLRYVARWEPLEQVTAHDWLSARVGTRAYTSLWEPLLVGKFGPHYKEVNMAWFWARIKARTPRLGTYEGGFQAFMDDLAERVRSEGADIRLQTSVFGIQARDDREVELSIGDERQAFNHCLVTTSPALLAQLAPDLPDPYLLGLKNMKSMGAVVMVLSLKHRLSEQGHYWHNLPKSAGFPFLSLVEHTNFVPAEHFGEEHIIYCGDYLDPDHEYFELSQFELLERFVPALSRINPAFEPEWINTSWLYRTSYAQPIPPVNHSRSIPDIQTPIPGLWLASMSQVYPWDRGTNFAVEVARRAAAYILAAN